MLFLHWVLGRTKCNNDHHDDMHLVEERSLRFETLFSAFVVEPVKACQVIMIDSTVVILPTSLAGRRNAADFVPTRGTNGGKRILLVSHLAKRTSHTRRKTLKIALEESLMDSKKNSSDTKTSRNNT